MNIHYVPLGDAMRTCQRYGWHVREPDLLDQALHRPHTSMYGTELFPGLHAKAAALMDSINRLHPLIDGNKRLSWIMALRMYRLNGYDIDADVDDAEKFVLDVAAGHLPVEQIAAWFADHAQVYPGKVAGEEG